MPLKPKKAIDPLFQLFEHNLTTRSYDDASKFTREVATGYLHYLDSTPAHVPLYARVAVLEDLEAETHELLVRKMYGVVQAADYANYGSVMRVNWEESLGRFDFATPAVPAEKPEKSE